DVKAGGLGDFQAQLPKAEGPVGERAAGDPKRDQRHLPAALPAPAQVGPREEGHRRPGRTQPVAVVKVVGVRHVEIDRLLDEPEPEHTDVEINVALRIGGDGGLRGGNPARPRGRPPPSPPRTPFFGAPRGPRGGGAYPPRPPAPPPPPPRTPGLDL